MKLRSALTTAVPVSPGGKLTYFLLNPFWEARAQAEETALLTCKGFPFPPQLLVLSAAR